MNENKVSMGLRKVSVKLSLWKMAFLISKNYHYLLCPWKLKTSFG